MPRARNIKPQFFDNEDLADLPPLARLLFIGLWTLADFKGDLEWRDRRIKKQILGYDNCCVTELAIYLDKSGFIRFYSESARTYVRIVNFCKHQNPHKNERAKGSEIPEFTDERRQAFDFKGLTINRDLSGAEREHSGTNRADSLFLIPSSGSPPTLESDDDSSSPPKGDDKQKFTDQDLDCAKWMSDHFKDRYRKATGKNHSRKINLQSWAEHVRKIRELDGHSHEEIRQLFTWVQADEFWQSNCQSPDKLRKQWDQLQLKCSKVKIHPTQIPTPEQFGQSGVYNL